MSDYHIHIERGWSGRDLDDIYCTYIDIMKRMAKSNLFDVLAHLDVIKVFGHRAPTNLDIEWESLLQLVAEMNLALNIPITIASDAHIPSDVGDRWEKVVAIARSSGYRTYCSFTGRKRMDHVLPSF